MAEILALLQVIAPLVSKTTLRQMSQVVYGLLVTNRRVSMLVRRPPAPRGNLRAGRKAVGAIARCNAGIRRRCPGCR
jgi:hypothetical protein